ncbi:hypothetical protein Slin15195_G106580 [Septoria linicola]|uniref:Uncharacterized protein n=1 Tax=Septoria linicola TaxID=215465 RepID=A0A9Q9AYB2_9PEZI|nr:hypothetical protein Slin14017_G069550 [Septoria linicola]USW57339.1 hypothetical protein Slin15195_G106580 [Septoria linicola]
MREKQDMQDLQNEQGSWSMLTTDSDLNAWTVDYNPDTDPYAKLGQTDEEQLAELDEILLPKGNQIPARVTTVLPSEFVDLEAATLFEDQKDQFFGVAELGFVQQLMTPGDVEHPFVTLPDDYTGLDLNYDIQQNAWPMVEDFGIPFELAEPVADSQPEQPQVLQSIEIPEDGAYHCLFDTFEDARVAIANSNSEETMLPLGVSNDDWQDIVSVWIHYYGGRLYKALRESPVETPEVLLLDYQRQYWREHQNSQLAIVAAAIKNLPDIAEARVMLVIEAVIKLHRDGCPASVMNRKTLKEGYKVDTTLIASARLDQIIEAVAKDKYVAHDIVTGTNIPDIVRSPAAYMRRKADNSRVNAKKAMDKEEADRNKGLKARRKKNAVTRGRNAAAREQQNFHPTPMTSSPTPSYGDMQSIPFSFDTAADSDLFGTTGGAGELDCT